MSLSHGLSIGGRGLSNGISALGGSSVDKLISATNAAELTIAALNPIAWYKFNEGSGQRVQDHSGFGNHGTVGADLTAQASDPTWTSTGLSFDGGDRVTLPAGLIAAGDNAVSMAVVITAFSTTGAYQVMMMTGLNVAQQGITLTVEGVTDNIYWAGISDTSNVAAPPSLPYSFCGTYNPSGGERRAYVNGSYSLAHSSTSTIAMNFPSAAVSYLGILTDGVTFGFSGGMAYALLFNSVLSDAQVTALHVALKDILAARGIVLP